LLYKCDLNDVTLHNEFLERKRFLAKHVIIPLTLKVIYFKATDTRAILFWRWQCNGGKIVALPSRERNCLCIMLCDGSAKLCAIVAEISNHLIFGNDCRKLGGVVKEGQG
jgi:hypothetical protein